MQIRTIRNVQFTRLIKTQGRLKEFNFRKLNGLNEGLITVDVSDEKGYRIMFTMKRDGRTYHIQNSQLLPDWVRVQEKIMSELIEAELRLMH